MPSKKSYITVTDQFCGAGGSSLGVEQCSDDLGLNNGVQVTYALNHWSRAIETHNTNFPNTHHDCCDISASDPRRYASTDILIASPECTNHTHAKGQKLATAQADLFDKQVFNPAAERSRATMWDVPRFAEYHDYNFVIVENVVEARKWRMWDAWLMSMHSLGYAHKCCYFNSQHFEPTPQSRDRLYVVFWKKGNPAPDLNHKPLAFCSKCSDNVHSVQSFKPNRVFGKYRTQYFYACPKCASKVEPYYYAAWNCIDWSIPGTRVGDRKKPLSKNTRARIQYGLDTHAKEPLMVQVGYTSGIGCRVRSLSDSCYTQVGTNKVALMQPPFTVDMGYTHAGEKRARSLANPIGTMTTVNNRALITPHPFLIKTDHTHAPSKSRSATGPGITQVTKQSCGVVVPPQLVELNRTGKSRLATEPISTVTAGGNKHGLLMTPLLVVNKGESKSIPATEALRSVTTKQHFGLVTSESFNAFIDNISRTGKPSHVTDSMTAMRTKGCKALVGYDPESIRIEDCYYRMLKPHETKAAMAFPSEYVVTGNSAEQQKQLGNAVTPPVMRWIAGQCIKTLI